MIKTTTKYIAAYGSVFAFNAKTCYTVLFVEYFDIVVSKNLLYKGLICIIYLNYHIVQICLNLKYYGIKKYTYARLCHCGILPYIFLQVVSDKW